MIASINHNFATAYINEKFRKLVNIWCCHDKNFWATFLLGHTVSSKQWDQSYINQSNFSVQKTRKTLQDIEEIYHTTTAHRMNEVLWNIITVRNNALHQFKSNRETYAYSQ